MKFCIQLFAPFLSVHDIPLIFPTFIFHFCYKLPNVLGRENLCGGNKNLSVYSLLTFAPNPHLFIITSSNVCCTPTSKLLLPMSIALFIPFLSLTCPFSPLFVFFFLFLKNFVGV